MSSTWRSDTAQLTAGGWCSSVYPGLGILGVNVASTGGDGPSALAGAISHPADDGVELIGYITRWPTHGVLDIDEGLAFTYTGTTDYFEFLLIAGGVPSTVDIGYGAGISRILLNVGSGVSFSGAVQLDAATAEGAFSSGAPSAIGGDVQLGDVRTGGMLSGQVLFSAPPFGPMEMQVIPKTIQ